MAFAGNHDGVARLRGGDGGVDRFSPVDDGNRLHTRDDASHYLRQDRVRILRPRVVARDIDEITRLAGGVGHARTFRSVAISSTAKDADDAARGKWSDGGQ